MKLNKLSQKAKDQIKSDVVLQARLMQLYDVSSHAMPIYWINNDTIHLQTVQAILLIKEHTKIKDKELYETQKMSLA